MWLPVIVHDYVDARKVYIRFMRDKGHSSESKIYFLENGKSTKFQNGYIQQIKIVNHKDAK